MIKFENLEVIGWDHAIRGMRNPKNSWDKMDSEWNSYSGSTEEGNLITSIDLRDYVVGPNDQELMIRLAKGGPVHAKF
jgi:hypothetical protein